MPGPAGWWRRQSLRARITIVTTAFFTAAVLAGSVLLVILLRTSLLRAIDESANNTAAVVRDLVLTGRLTNPIVTGNTDVQQVQVLDADQKVVAATRTADRMVGVLRPDELDRATDNRPVQVDGDRIGADAPVRVTVVSAGDYRVLVVSDLGGVVDSARILGRVAVVAGPIAVLMIGALTYWIVALTLRPVGELAAGASTITAAGLSNQRLPVQDADDEIHRLAITLNAMLDRIDVATARQRTFVGDAAHELRSPLASLRLQLEIAGRLGPDTDWPSLIDEALVDIDRLDRLVDDLLTLARLDEDAGAIRVSERVSVGDLVRDAVGAYEHARVPVGLAASGEGMVLGSADALRRVVVNLVDNAIRHASTRVDVAVQEGGGTVQITVSDDGPGIPGRDRLRVFDRFYRGDESRSRDSGGTGLGLAIVRDLVRAHGGSVVLSENEGLPAGTGPGLRAVVTLPRVATDQ